MDRLPTKENSDLWHRAVPISWRIFGDDDHIGVVMDKMAMGQSDPQAMVPVPATPPAWHNLMSGGYVARPVDPSAIWSRHLGDYTVESAMAMVAWEGYGTTPENIPAILTRFLVAGDWAIGLYRDPDVMVGVWDVGRLVEGGRRQLCDLYTVRPEFRGLIPAETFQGLATQFIAWLKSLGVRQMMAYHVLATQEGRRHSARSKRYGYRTEAVHGFRETMVKDI